jgi:hypothetical protein
MDPAVKLDTVVKVFLKIRTARHDAKKAWEAHDATLEAQQEELENFLLGYTNQTGVDSFRTAYGTVYKTPDIVPSASDWDAFYKWIAENDAFDALERRIKKTFISTYMETNKGELPPGVSVFRQMKISVRRSNTSVETGD